MTTRNFTTALRAAASLDDLPINPIAAMLRRHTADEFAALKASVRQVGVTNPIGIDATGNLVDGRHRCQAVIELRAEGIEVADPPINIIPCAPADYVWAQICGRQMSKGQLAYLAIQICQNSDTPLTAAAERYGVSRQTLNLMKQLLDAAPELAERVASGELSLNKAVTLLELGAAETARRERDAAAAEAVRLFEVELQALIDGIDDSTTDAEFIRIGSIIGDQRRHLRTRIREWLARPPIDTAEYRALRKELTEILAEMDREMA